MSANAPDFLTTRELADLLRIKERKVYDMAAGGEVPCVRATGKLLFPRGEIMAWLSASHSGPRAAEPLPAIVVGSHDPLLDWALRESGSGLAAFCDGSLDGLARLAGREAAACGLHVHEMTGTGESWNIETLHGHMPGQPVVLIELFRRARGLIIAPDQTKAIRSVTDLAGHRVARRQATAASQAHFEEILRANGVDPADLAGPESVARSETDLALLVRDGKADCAFGLEAMARQFHLAFLPLVSERYDLAVWRQAYFEPPLQRLMAFLRGDGLRDQAAEMGGYDIAGLGSVHLNGPG